jgi:hypothetical protein
MLRTAIWLFWLAIRSNNPNEAAIVPFEQVPFLESMSILLRACGDAIQNSQSVSHVHVHGWPDDPTLQCKATFQVLGHVNALFDIFKMLVAPPSMDDKLIEPTWLSCHSQGNHHILPVLNPYFRPELADVIHDISQDYSIQGALANWNLTARRMTFQPSALPELPDAWLSPDTSVPRYPRQKSAPPGYPPSSSHSSGTTPPDKVDKSNPYPVSLLILRRMIMPNVNRVPSERKNRFSDGRAPTPHNGQTLHPSSRTAPRTRNQSSRVDPMARPVYASISA